MEGSAGGKWNKIFSQILGSTSFGFIEFFFPACLMESCSIGYGLKDLFPLHMLHDKIVCEL